MARQTARQHAAEQEKRAIAKLNRLRRNGVDISTIDPRQSTEGMNSRQLSRYADRLRSFNSNRGYVAGVNGAPIARAAFQVYQALERRNNRVSERYNEEVGPVIIPVLGQDIASQIARRNAEKFRMGGEQATFQRFERNAEDITGQDSILSLIGAMRKKTKPSYLKDRMDVYRNNLSKMFETLNDPTSQEMLDELTDKQLNILVDYTPFMNAMSGRYEFQKTMNVDETFKPENWMTEIFDTNAEEIHELFHWAKNGVRISEETDDESSGKHFDPDRRRRIVPRKRPTRRNDV